MAVPEESLLEDPVMLTIADRHHATPAQIALAWGLHRGTSLVVKSVDSLRMQENLGAVDIRLSEIELSEISGLNRGRRYNDPGQFCEQAFNTLYPIYD
jgi:D-xylose reductase